MTRAQGLLDAPLPLWRVPNPVLASNTYLLATGAPKRCLVIDPGLDCEPVLQALQALALTPVAVLCTHGHFDHAGGAAELQRRYGCEVYLHGADEKTLRQSNFLLMAFRIPGRVTMPRLCFEFGGEVGLPFDRALVRFYPTPGHTPGSCALACGKILFTGDTLYSHGVGLSRLPGEDAARLRRSVTQLLEGFDADTMICPGHGDVATLGWIREHNQALQRFLGARDALCDS